MKLKTTTVIAIMLVILLISISTFAFLGEKIRVWATCPWDRAPREFPHRSLDWCIWACWISVWIVLDYSFKDHGSLDGVSGFSFNNGKIEKKVGVLRFDLERFKKVIFCRVLLPGFFKFQSNFVKHRVLVVYL